MPLPTFVIAGERRCGTTSLAKWMMSHPEVYICPHLDRAFFLETELVGEDKRSWWEGEADARRWEQTHSVESYEGLFSEARAVRAIGEKSADYLFWRPAHQRISRYLPDALFIVTLRDPITRAWSHYWNEVGKGRETLSFEDAIAAEDERCTKSAYARDHLSYVRRGFYDESLRAFFESIGRERVLIVTVEESRARPRETLSRIYGFIGVNPRAGLDCIDTSHNANWTTVMRPWARLPGISRMAQMQSRALEFCLRKLIRDKARRREWAKRLDVIFRRPASSVSMSRTAREGLRAVYSSHIDALEHMLNRKFAEWR